MRCNAMNRFRLYTFTALLSLLLALAGYYSGSTAIAAVERILDNATAEAVAEMIGG